MQGHLLKSIFATLILFANQAYSQATPDLVALGKTDWWNLARPKLNTQKNVIVHVEPSINQFNIVLQNYKNGKIELEFPETSAPKTLALSANNQWIAYVNGLNELKVIDRQTKSMALYQPLDNKDFPFLVDTKEAQSLLHRQKLEFSPDGRFLAIMLTTDFCPYVAPSKVALVDLKQKTINIWQGNAMVGDIVFSGDSSSLLVFNSCDQAQAAAWKWETHDPKNNRPFGNSQDGVMTAFDLPATDEVFLVWSTQVSRGIHPTGKLSKTDGLVVPGSNFQTFIDTTPVISRDGEQALSVTLDGLHHLSNNNITTTRSKVYQNIYASEDWQMAIGYAQNYADIEIWDLGRHKIVKKIARSESGLAAGSFLLDADIQGDVLQLLWIDPNASPGALNRTRLHF